MAKWSQKSIRKLRKTLRAKKLAAKAAASNSRVTNLGVRQPRSEAPPTDRLTTVMHATEKLPFGFTMFFTNENGETIKFGRFMNRQMGVQP